MKLSESEKERILILFKDGKNPFQISKIINRKNTTISSFLNKNNLLQSSKNLKNENVFENITKENAFILGAVFAAGRICQNRNDIIINSKNINLINSLSLFLLNKECLKKTLSITSKKIKNDLINLNFGLYPSFNDSDIEKLFISGVFNAAGLINKNITINKFAYNIFCFIQKFNFNAIIDNNKLVVDYSQDFLNFFNIEEYVLRPKNSKKDPKISSAQRVFKKRYSDGNLTFDKFYELSQKQCTYCGVEPSNLQNCFKNDKNSSKFGRENGDFIYNGLDRVDNKKPHNIDNVVSCCFICNRTKRDLSIDEFMNWIQRVLNENRFTK